MITFFYLSPLLLATVLLLAGLWLGPGDRRLWLQTVLPVILCGLLDALQLELLPILRLSFGPAGIPLFIFTLARLLLLLPFLLGVLLSRKSTRSLKVLPVLSGSLQILLTLLAFDSLYIEPFHLTLTTLQPESPSFLDDRPLRILHLTDLHMEHPTRREEDILARIDLLQPDIILLTGDYLNPTFWDDPLTLAETRQFLEQLHAPYGIYAVNGNVDIDHQMSLLFDGLEEIQVLEDDFVLQQFPGGTLALVGVTYSFVRSHDAQALQGLMAQVPPEAYTILLYHTPDLIETASASRVDLYLAGHTHGGQVRLPFYGALVTFSAYGKQYEMGEYHVGGTMLYVSRGLGMEGWEAPRMRFLCPPEMEIVELGE
jgi:predicted MPP superfamily phosphohydrolase